MSFTQHKNILDGNVVAAGLLRNRWVDRNILALSTIPYAILPVWRLSFPLERKRIGKPITSIAGNLGNGGHMYISEHMTPDPITVPPDMLLPEARRLLNTHHIRHLPVVDREKKLIGIVTDRDLRSAYPSSVTSKHDKILAFEQVGKTTVADIMTTTCAALSPDASLDDALLLFDREKIGGIPILSEEGVVLGFFSILDLTAAYRKLFGMAERGSLLIGLEDDGRDNILSEIVILLEQNDIVLTRLIRLAESKDTAKIYMRINSQRPEDVCRLLEMQGFLLLQ